MKHAVEHYFGGGSELLNMHERMADLLLINLSSSFEDAGDCLALLFGLPKNLTKHSAGCCLLGTGTWSVVSVLLSGMQSWAST